MVNEQLIVDFVNTAGFGPEREELETPAALVARLEEHDLKPGARATGTDLAEARRVREALRELLWANNHVPTDVVRAEQILEEASERAKLRPRFTAGGVLLEPAAAGVAGALGRILAEVHAAMAGGNWSRMKACRAGDCRYAFVDTARNRSRAWCSMELCGNRAKVEAYRKRRRT